MDLEMDEEDSEIETHEGVIKHNEGRKRHRWKQWEVEKLTALEIY